MKNAMKRDTINLEIDTKYREKEIVPGLLVNANPYLIQVRTVFKDIFGDFGFKRNPNPVKYMSTFAYVAIYDMHSGACVADNVILPAVAFRRPAIVKRYIPNYQYGPWYMGNVNYEPYKQEHIMWKDMLNKIFCPNTNLFKYYGATGARVEDRWRCFEYFLLDLPLMDGYKDCVDPATGRLKSSFCIDFYDCYKRIAPENRIYCRAACEIMPFRDSRNLKFYIDDKNMRYAYPCNAHVTIYPRMYMNYNEPTFNYGMTGPMPTMEGCYKYNPNEYDITGKYEPPRLKREMCGVASKKIITINPID